jgi:RNA polymerase subunit RPABC4/transcription elongation factor Spt4
VASQTCEQCGAKVASDEQFCPSCGSFLDPMATPRPGTAPSKPSGNVISVSSDGPGVSDKGPYEEFSLEDGPPSEKGPTDEPPRRTGRPEVTCPTCGAVNPGNNRHCQECGARLSQGPLPTAPRPAVQATAGVRAALAISGLLLTVILVALFVNVFSGDGSAPEGSTTTTSTTTPEILESEPIDVLSVSCDPEGISTLVCNNLISGVIGQKNEYQVSWEENRNNGVKITFTFREPIAISEIQWTNIDDPDRFKQNYRAHGLSIKAQDSLTDFPAELLDQQGTQLIQYTALNTSRLEITVVSAYESEIVKEERYDELAIDEIVIVGRPAKATTTATTVPTSDG